MSFEKMPLPEEVMYIIEKLNRAGERADAVGGAVRDFLLGKIPGDYDITTSATPDRMKEIFLRDRVVETGIKHGTLSVILSGKAYEITTYRIDGKYSDARHPEAVEFTEDIKEDLARRDFTVNAMAYNPTDGFTDIFGGTKDLELGIIRAVGEPEKRFSEDALRILRALRFASVLDFSIEGNTSKALYKTKELLSKISRERIYTEWRKLLSGVGAYRIIDTYRDLIPYFIPELAELSLPEKKLFEKASPHVRMLSLFADKGADVYNSAMLSLRADTKSREMGAIVLENLKRPLLKKTDIKRALSEFSAETVLALAELRHTLSLSETDECGVINEVISGGECYRLSDMRLGGADLIALGLSGADIGRALARLLNAVISEEVPNEREELLSYCSTHIVGKP